MKAASLLKIIEQIKPIMTNHSIKAEITKLSNLLFQSILLPENKYYIFSRNQPENESQETTQQVL